MHTTIKRNFVSDFTAYIPIKDIKKRKAPIIAKPRLAAPSCDSETDGARVRKISRRSG